MSSWISVHTEAKATDAGSSVWDMLEADPHFSPCLKNKACSEGGGA